MTQNDSDDEEKNSNSNSTTRIDGSLSGLSLTVETEGKENCKELFNETWDKMLTDAENMSDGLDERMNSL